jgi:2-keto-4-pentenoate hydratase/2-oxohepta-3-ene-1,7-dioic acid hydratase in catechol pathway
MKLARMIVDGTEHLGRIEGDHAWPFSASPLVELLNDGKDIYALASGGGSRVELGEARLLAPLRPGKIIAVGLNYADHAREAGLSKPEVPLLFAKFPTSVIGPEEPIVLDESLTTRVDWEVELAVIIGEVMRNVAEEDALQGVFGYTVANDVSARDGGRDRRPAGPHPYDSRKQRADAGQLDQRDAVRRRRAAQLQLQVFRARARRRASHWNAVGCWRVQESEDLPQTGRRGRGRG